MGFPFVGFDGFTVRLAEKVVTDENQTRRTKSCFNARVPFFRFAPSPYVQPFARSHVFSFRPSLAPVGSVVFGPGGHQCLHQCGVQRRLCASAGVCRGHAHGGANRFEPAAIPFAGFVDHGTGAASLRGFALAAGGGLAHAAWFALVQFQPLCPPCAFLGCFACPGALGWCGLDIRLAGFGRGSDAGVCKSKSTGLS